MSIDWKILRKVLKGPAVGFLLLALSVTYLVTLTELFGISGYLMGNASFFLVVLGYYVYTMYHLELKHGGRK